MILGLLLLAQALAPGELRLYNEIFSEPSPAVQLKLLLQFERDFPQSKFISEIYGTAMELYRRNNNHPKVVEYGEKAIKSDPEHLQALTVVAQRYSLEGRNLDTAVAYAERALTVAKKKPRPDGTSPQAWDAYVQQIVASAESTLRYIRAIPSQLFKNRGR